MEYVLTEHARDAVAKRQIRLSWVELAMFKPEITETDPVDPELEHRLARIQEFGNRVLCLVVNSRKEPPHIVTAFFDRRRTLP